MNEHMVAICEQAKTVSTIKDLLSLSEDLLKMYEQSGQSELLNQYVAAREGTDAKKEELLEEQIMKILTTFQTACAALDDRLHELLPGLPDLRNELPNHDETTRKRLMNWWMAKTVKERERRR